MKRDYVGTDEDANEMIAEDVIRMIMANQDVTREQAEYLLDEWAIRELNRV